MTLEDILKIDTCPFDEHVLDECIAGEQYVPYTLRNSLCNLIIRYLNLFWEKYQPDLVRTCVPDRLVGVCDMEEEAYLYWIEETQDIMYTVTCANGWQCICLHYCSGDIELSDDYGNDEDAEIKQFHKAYMEYLDELGVEGFARKLFENEEALMRDAVCCTEDAEIGILLNTKLSAYNAIKKQNAAIVYEVCREEDLIISELEHDIWMPFWVCFVEEKKEYEGEEYGIFLLGSDGYNFYYFDRFDPNWACKTFVMDQLLDIALKKLEDYTAAEKAVA